MLSEIKALVVVLTLALTVFALAKPYCLQFTAPEDYARRRNVWVILTVGAFLLPNIWLYALLAFPLVFWAGRADRHPTAVYLLLMLVVPPVSIPIPLFLVNQLFELTH